MLCDHDEDARMVCLGGAAVSWQQAADAPYIRPRSEDAYSLQSVKCVKPQYPHRINEIRHEE